MTVIESKLDKVGTCGFRVGPSNPCPGRHGTVAPHQVEAARKETEWWHARYVLTGDVSDYAAYLKAAAELQDKRQYCTEYTREGGLA